LAHVERVKLPSTTRLPPVPVIDQIVVQDKTFALSLIPRLK